MNSSNQIKWIAGLVSLIIVATFVVSFNYKGTLKQSQTKMQTSYNEISNQYLRKAKLLETMAAYLRTIKKQKALAQKAEAQYNNHKAKLELTDFSDDNVQAFKEFVREMDQSFKTGMLILKKRKSIATTDDFKKLEKDLYRADIRIKVSKQRHKRTIKNYNEDLEKFPHSFFAGFFDINPWPNWL